MRLSVLPFLLIITMVITACIGEDVLDPFDMINFDPSTKTMKKKSQPDKSENVVPVEKEVNTEDKKPDILQKPLTIPPVLTTTAAPPVVEIKPQKTSSSEKDMGTALFRRFVTKFLSYFERKAPDLTQEYHVWIKLSKDQYSILQKFANGRSNIHDAEEILVNMITDVTKSNVGSTEKFTMWFEEKTGTSLDAVLKMVAIMSLMSIVLYMEIKVHISWRKRVMQLIMLAFIISIPMTWYELYQTAQISQQTVTMKEAPKECVQDMDEGNLLSVYASAFKRLFTLEKDKCQQYYEHMLIDPFLKVTPTKAIAVTFVRFFLAPLKDIGTAFSEFIRALLIDLPLTLYPVAIATLSVFFFMLLFMWFGYSIRLPFFLSIEPSPVMSIRNSVDNNQAIEDVKKQLEVLQGCIQTSETNMADQIKRLAETQMKSIEYTAAAMQNNVPPPTSRPAITVEKSDQSFEVVVKSPIPCSDDSFSMDDDIVVVQETATQKIVQETIRPIDTIGPVT